MTNQYLHLSIDWRTKSIPYSTEKHDDGSENYEFFDLKGNLDKCKKIREAKEDKYIQNALIKINSWDTLLFTVGCEKCYNREKDNTARPIGFIEVCVNSIPLASNVQTYFNIHYQLYKKKGVSWVKSFQAVEKLKIYMMCHPEQSEGSLVIKQLRFFT